MEIEERIDVVTAVAAGLPGYLVTSVERIGVGLDNLAYEVNGELIVRFVKDPDPEARAGLVEREARLLAAVAAVSPVPVPEPKFTVPELGCLSYPKLAGTILLDVPEAWRIPNGTAIAAQLGDLLAALHAVPLDRLAGVVEEDALPLAEWLDEARTNYAEVLDNVPSAYRGRVEAFLEAPPPADRFSAVFSHNDLGIEHVLVEPDSRTVTGVIDWSDAAAVDPAFDIGRLHRDLGPAAADAALSRLPTDDGAIGERAGFYARCGVFEDLAFGLGAGRLAYVDKCVSSLAWLFPP